MSYQYESNTYRCELLRVVDGDTLQLRVDLGLRCERTLYIRIADINAPEKRGEERELGKAAAAHAQVVFDEMVGTGQPVYAKFRKGKSFDRWVGEIFVALGDGDTAMDFGDEMVKAGHAVHV